MQVIFYGGDAGFRKNSQQVLLSVAESSGDTESRVEAEMSVELNDFSVCPI